MSEITSKRKTKKKYDTFKLPTPPPDPRETKGNELFEYVENLQKRADSKSGFASAMIANDAFDHLEKLYKLMEQMLELRAQNARLHRKIRDLEYSNNLEKMYRQVEESGNEECQDLDKDTAFTERILESILTDGKTTKASTFSRQSILRKQRNRSSSTVESPSASNKTDPFKNRRASVYYPSSSQKNAKVSKWTKVKAAFKWEKASPIDAKSMDSGISGVTQPVEVARYLRVPSLGEDLGHSPNDSGAAEISTPGSLSTASSNEDFHHKKYADQYNPCEGFHSSDDDNSHANSHHCKNELKTSPNLSNKSINLPWSRVKNIIPTRSSLKKKTRLSTHSDEVQIDIELCSDNEDVFEDENKSYPTLSTTPCSLGKSDSDNDIPVEIIRRYRRVSKEDTGENNGSAKDVEYKKLSNWTKVKKAFLPSLDIEKANQIREVSNSEKVTPESKRCIQFEIDRNYRQLQNKLSIEFQEKFNEWKKINQSDSPKCQNEETVKPDKPTLNKPKPIPMTSQENLPPEFKKKLDEWEKIKKASVRSGKKSPETPRWKLLQSQTSVEIPVITDDFRKKLEEWKQIKSEMHHQDESDKKGNKTPSPGIVKRNATKKGDKEIQWYEKELSKIEKEKERLEKERLKFLEREERLTKLRKSVVGTDKKDIFVHTPSGFYKFEGISRKFTQKLYEWEKSQGIGPESSTFAFLTSDSNPKEIAGGSDNKSDNLPTLTRSKSADSLHISLIPNEKCPLKSQPSSLSLSNMKELEEQCMVNSNDSSMEFKLSENTDDQAKQPEALIVEVNDFVEETATPLTTKFTEHIPVYQCENSRTLGTTCIAANIRRRESTKAQLNYYLIENIFSVLQNLTHNDRELTNFTNTDEEIEHLQAQQKLLFAQLYNKLLNLQKENSSVVMDITKDHKKQPGSRLSDMIDIVQDLSFEIVTMADKLEEAINEKLKHNTITDYATVSELIFGIKSKLFELRRHLSYVCAVSDSTAPRRKASCECSEDKQKQGNARIYTKAETANAQSQGAIKKRIRYRQRYSRKKSFEDSDDDEDNQKYLSSNKVLKSKSQDSIKDLKLTQSNSTANTSNDESYLDSPVTVFVKTTRKLFTPLVKIDMHDEVAMESIQKDETDEKKHDDENEDKIITISDDTIVPLSPFPTKKVFKDVSPSIRIMLDKYNEKITQDSNVKQSSSGSNSPVAWRSPIAEKRVKAQTEKYQEEISKLSPLFQKRMIEKSASLALINNRQKITSTRFNQEMNAVQKSVSSATVGNEKIKHVDNYIPQKNPLHLTLDINAANVSNISSSIRQQKLKKAKEEFLSATPLTQQTPATTETTKSLNYPSRKRLSQLSVDSSSSMCSSSPGVLTKSVSAGMIHIDSQSYQKIDSDGRCSISLPRFTKPPSSKTPFGNLAEKFRKVRMRKGKERASAVSALCRQSLLVDINPTEGGSGVKNERISQSSMSLSSKSKSTSWLQKAKIFKR